VVISCVPSISGEMFFSLHSIHDLHAADVASHGLKKPFLPRPGFLVIADRKQRFKREGPW
jgi:hypothetical protein